MFRLKGIGARLIVHELVVLEVKLSLVNWTDGATKSSLTEMRNKIKIKSSNSRLDYYQTSKCVETLRKVPYLAEALTALFNEVESAMKNPKCIKIRDAPRMVNVIIKFQKEYFLRDKKLSREDLDSGQINFFSFSVSNT